MPQPCSDIVEPDSTPPGNALSRFFEPGAGACKGESDPIGAGGLAPDVGAHGYPAREGSIDAVRRSTKTG